MRRLSRICSIATICALLASVEMPTSGAAATPRSIYLALGDSLAASYQPTGEMHSGYAEQLFQVEQERFADLRLVKLACPGETTRTIDVAKRRCPYPEGTQLAQALEILRTRDVAFVTLQIGTNDLLRCFSFRAVTFDEECIGSVLPRISARLTSTVEALREAAGPDVPIIGSNYYNPLVVAWTLRGVDRGAVMAIAEVWSRFNDTLEETYAALDVPVADIEAAFSATDFDTIVHVRGFGHLPISVARACQWTYACSEAGFDPHANTVGYAVMTRAWEAVLAEAFGGNA